MTALKATLVDSEKRKTRITCYRCELSYTARNYDILFESRKLAYFKFKPIGFKRPKLFCHDCMHWECMNMLKGPTKKVKLTMDLGEEVIICTFEK